MPRAEGVPLVLWHLSDSAHSALVVLCCVWTNTLRVVRVREWERRVRASSSAP